MASVQIPRGGPPRSIEVPPGNARSREGSLRAVPGAALHGLTEDEVKVIQKTYPKARVIPAKVQVQPSREFDDRPKNDEPKAVEVDEKPKTAKPRPEPRRTNKP